MDTSLDFARNLDSQDPLASFRDEFYSAEPDMIYMDGNSLGRLPLETIDRYDHLLKKEWGDRLIRSWNEKWITWPAAIGDKIAKLVGASEGECLVADSTTINLFKLIMAALDLKPDRTKIVSDVFNFPTDLYVLQSCNHLKGDRYQIALLNSRDGVSIDWDEIEGVIDENTAVVSLSHVVFKSGFMYDAKRLTEYAHSKGALVLWDLCHSTGSVPVALNEWGADFAVGCTYKYLNGGPGSPAFLFVRKGLQEKAMPPIWGWYGDSKPFAFDLEYSPAGDVRRFLSGTSSIMSYPAIECGVDKLLEAGIEQLRKKSIALSSYLIDLVDEVLAPYGFKLGTPRDVNLRGSHVSIQHEEGYRINCALINEMNVVPDFREPNNIRLGLAPLYTSFEDVWTTVERIRVIMAEEKYTHFSSTRIGVT
ncbi:MAG TPA: kynureninase [Anaerolineaceae bacterium]|nr:kynureninase [Anaerolineaceae bacterium]